MNADGMSGIEFAKLQNQILREMGFSPYDTGKIITEAGPGLAVTVARWTLWRIEDDKMKSMVQTVFSGLDPEYSRKRTLATLNGFGYEIPDWIARRADLLDRFIDGVRAVAICRSLDNALHAMAFDMAYIEDILRDDLEEHARRAA